MLLKLSEKEYKRFREYTSNNKVNYETYSSAYSAFCDEAAEESLSNLESEGFEIPDKNRHDILVDVASELYNDADFTIDKEADIVVRQVLESYNIF